MINTRSSIYDYECRLTHNIHTIANIYVSNSRVLNGHIPDKELGVFISLGAPRFRTNLILF